MTARAGLQDGRAPAVIGRWLRRGPSYDLQTVNPENAMSLISSLSTPSAGTASLGAYERNARTYGAAVASVIGAADALGAAATSTASFSSAALDKASQAIGDGVDEVVEVSQAAYDGLSNAVKKTYGAVADAGSGVADAVGEVMATVGDCAGVAVTAVTQAIDQVL